MIHDDSIPGKISTPPSTAGIPIADAHAALPQQPPPEPPSASEYNPFMRFQFGAMNMGLPPKSEDICPVCQKKLTADAKEVSLGGQVYLCCPGCNPAQAAAIQAQSQPPKEAETQTAVETPTKIWPKKHSKQPIKSTALKPAKSPRRPKAARPSLRPT